MDEDAKKRRLANLRPFRPGQSGNPTGRSKAEIDVRTLARAYTKEAIEALVLVMREGKPSESALAANSLLDRAWGKPILADAAAAAPPLVIKFGEDEAKF
jgi:hypothetical protein